LRSSLAVSVINSQVTSVFFLFNSLSSSKLSATSISSLLKRIIYTYFNFTKYTIIKYLTFEFHIIMFIPCSSPLLQQLHWVVLQLLPVSHLFPLQLLFRSLQCLKITGGTWHKNILEESCSNLRLTCFQDIVTALRVCAEANLRDTGRAFDVEPV